MASEYMFVVNEKDMSIEDVDKDGRNNYNEKASFSMELVKHIVAGHDDSGFICNVYCSLRDERRICYFKINRALSGGLSKFLEDLNRSYGSGVLTSGFEPQEFKSFLKWLMRNYFRKCRINGSIPTFKAAVCIGRQPDTDTWVLGEQLQIKDEGRVVGQDVTSIVFISSILDCDDNRKFRSVSNMPLVKLPLSSLTLGDMIKCVVSTLHSNATAGVFSIAGILLGLHYQSVIDCVGYCPVPVACGTNRLGKTQSAKAALSLIGNSANFYYAVKDRFIPRLLSRSTLPPVLDDNKIPKILENVALSLYNNGMDGTCLFETKPRTCPLFTVNWETLDGLDKDERYDEWREI